MSPRVVGAGDFPKLVVVAAGPSECGKTRALEELFLVDAPRRLSIDFNGEMKAKHPDAIEVFSMPELREQLAAVAERETWHIALCTDPENIPELAPELGRILNPARTSAQHISYSREVGGIAIDCSEARNFVPNLKSGWASHTVAMFERGRHNRLSLFMATQAPQSIERRVTDSANHLLAFRTQEEAVWQYWRATTSTHVADIIASLPKYHCAWIEKDAQRIYLLDDERETYRVVDYKGTDVDDVDQDDDASGGGTEGSASDIPGDGVDVDDELEDTSSHSGREA